MLLDIHRRLIIPPVARRIHVSSLQPGEILLDKFQAHHLREVLRLKIGSSVELFTDGGLVAQGTVTRADPEAVTVRVETVEQSKTTGELIVASAIPKGDRADWMIEKLSELGVARFIPLKTARSVVHPTGQSKRERWMRIATESAKQSHRAGVMRIDELTEIDKLLAGDLTPLPGLPLKWQAQRWYLSTKEDAVAIGQFCKDSHLEQLFLLIGPEGGWTDEELSHFASSGLTGVKLTATILRVETAAIAAAAIAATMVVSTD
jgi:16S rRNA (uracil1498-N3)-methyltransferase